jgi:hypothetical protein
MAGFSFKRIPIRNGYGLVHRLPFKWFFTAGFIFGIIFMNIEKSTLLDSTGLFNENTFIGMNGMSVDSSALFYYVLKKRFGSAAVLAILSTTYLGLPVCALFVLWQGVLFGSFIAALAFRYGIKGIILAFMSMFPQYLIYIPAFIGLIFMCESLNRKIYFQKYPENILNKKNKLADLTKIPIVFSAIFIGTIFESFVNPKLLTWFLKIF